MFTFILLLFALACDALPTTKRKTAPKPSGPASPPPTVANTTTPPVINPEFTKAPLAYWNKLYPNQSIPVEMTGWMLAEWTGPKTSQGVRIKDILPHIKAWRHRNSYLIDNMMGGGNNTEQDMSNNARYGVPGQNRRTTPQPTSTNSSSPTDQQRSSQGTPSTGISSQGTPSQGTSSQGTPSQGTSHQGTPSPVLSQATTNLTLLYGPPLPNDTRIPTAAVANASQMIGPSLPANNTHGTGIIQQPGMIQQPGGNGTQPAMIQQHGNNGIQPGGLGNYGGLQHGGAGQRRSIHDVYNGNVTQPPPQRARVANGTFTGIDMVTNLYRLGIPHAHQYYHINMQYNRMTPMYRRRNNPPATLAHANISVLYYEDCITVCTGILQSLLNFSPNLTTLRAGIGFVVDVLNGNNIFRRGTTHTSIFQSIINTMWSPLLADITAAHVRYNMTIQAQAGMMFNNIPLRMRIIYRNNGNRTSNRNTTRNSRPTGNRNNTGNYRTGQCNETQNQ